MRELQDLVPDWQFAGHVDLFGLESAPEQMEPFFTDITVERFDDEILRTAPFKKISLNHLDSDPAARKRRREFRCGTRRKSASTMSGDCK